MMPVNPPAARASRMTAGNQKRRKMCLRSPGGAFTIAPGVYDFKRFMGGFAAIVLSQSFSPNSPLNDALWTMWLPTVLVAQVVNLRPAASAKNRLQVSNLRYIGIASRRLR